MRNALLQRPLLFGTWIGGMCGFVVIAVATYAVTRMEMWSGMNLGEVTVGVSVVVSGVAGMLLGLPTGAYAGFLGAVLVSDDVELPASSESG